MVFSPYIYYPSYFPLFLISLPSTYDLLSSFMTYRHTYKNRYAYIIYNYTYNFKFLAFRMKGNMCCLSFRLWLISLSIMISSCIRIPENSNISIFFIAKQNSVVSRYHICLIHSCAEGRLGWFHFLVTMTPVTINLDALLTWTF